MSDLENVEVQELRERLEFILNEVDRIFIEISPNVKKIGNFREEAEIIYKELLRRGIPLTEKIDRNDNSA